MSHSNKSVTFGGVFHFPSLPKTPNPNSEKKSQKIVVEKGEKTDTIKKGFNCVGTLRNSLKHVSANGSTLIAIRLVRSKLRKRDENQLNHVSGPTVTNHNNNIISPPDVVVSTVTAVTSTQTAVLQPPLEPAAIPPPFLWQYSASKPAINKTSSQYTLYSNDQESLVRNVSCEEPSECRKGVRKNLGGKLRRLIKKKPQQEAYTIPAELRDQLKQIYVY